MAVGLGMRGTAAGDKLASNAEDLRGFPRLVRVLLFLLVVVAVLIGQGSLLFTPAPAVAVAFGLEPLYIGEWLRVSAFALAGAVALAAPAKRSPRGRFPILAVSVA